jgi:hypothetical protein
MNELGDLRDHSLDVLESIYVSAAEHDNLHAFLCETTASIADKGESGLAVLLKHIPAAHGSVLSPLLLGLSFVKSSVLASRLDSVRLMLRTLISDADTDAEVIVEAIDCAACHSMRELRDVVLPHLEASNPYVVGSVLRFVSRMGDVDAPAILTAALHSKDAIVRQNAIDELDSISYTSALAEIQSLTDDDDEDVREAARTAVKNLSEC